ncbi:helix-turn-helix transcriptional regulator [Puerhibacterium puerhi]|uniref:helix-turn-helix transcriptional regulator n=1 Tax=Puerhibacterium puerhi TaxID=2692623 RepID=UPI00135A8461|nr:WYL domain-containing protein [Puerhibacterium puerhi]
MTDATSRLLRLLSLLQTPRDWPGAALAERLGVSPRTLRRDVDRLRALGYRVRAVKGPDGGYRLDAGAELPPLLFDDEQAVALAVALRTQAGAAGGLGEAAAGALATMRQVLPARLRHRLDALRFAVLPAGPAASAAVEPATLLALTAAIDRREVLRFDHAGAGAPAGGPPRRVEPHHLVTRGGLWYLVAWDLDRDDWRTFRADRVTPRTPTGPRFARREVPGGDVGAFVAERFRGGPGDAGGGWPCRGEAVLALPAAEVAPFAGDAVVEAVGPGRSRVLAGSWSWPALAAWLGRFDAEIEAVSPPELSDAFAALAARYARAATPRGA